MYHLAAGFKANWLDKSGYQIKSPIGFEMLDMSMPIYAYDTHPRMIYMAIE